MVDSAAESLSKIDRQTRDKWLNAVTIFLEDIVAAESRADRNVQLQSATQNLVNARLPVPLTGIQFTELSVDCANTSRGEKSILRTPQEIHNLGLHLAYSLKINWKSPLQTEVR